MNSSFSWRHCSWAACLCCSLLVFHELCVLWNCSFILTCVLTCSFSRWHGAEVQSHSTCKVQSVSTCRWSHCRATGRPGLMPNHRRAWSPAAERGLRGLWRYSRHTAELRGFISKVMCKLQCSFMDQFKKQLDQRRRSVASSWILSSSLHDVTRPTEGDTEKQLQLFPSLSVSKILCISQATEQI